VFGKAAALAATAGLGVTQQLRAKALSARLDLARELHERVVQRLFGVSLALGSDHELTQQERERCAAEIHQALAEMREEIARPMAPEPLSTGALLDTELPRLARHYEHLALEVDWEPGVKVPPQLEPLAQTVLAEALRNCDKHATPTTVRVHVGALDGAFVLEVLNDGVEGEGNGGRRPGMGLRLAALQAIQSGGTVEFGPTEQGGWRVRLVAPRDEEAE
jgi:signal transduction histidine kinase